MALYKTIFFKADIGLIYADISTIDRHKAKSTDKQKYYHKVQNKVNSSG